MRHDPRRYHRSCGRDCRARSNLLGVLFVTITIPVTIRTRDGAVPLTIDGLAPFADCVLAVTPVYDRTDYGWRKRKRGGFYITHCPTGYQLGKRIFETEEEALAVLERCDPTFPAWPLAGDDNSVARMACHAKFRAAINNAQ